MFEKFFSFVNLEGTDGVNSIDEFLRVCSGKTFINSLYRIHIVNDIRICTFG